MFHPIRTLLRELFLDPVLRVLQGRQPKESPDTPMHDSRQHRAGTALAPSSGANTALDPAQAIASAVTIAQGNPNPTIVEEGYVPYPETPSGAKPVYKPYAEI